MHQPRPHIWLECQGEVVGEHLLISSPGNLNNDGVDDQELGWPSDLQLLPKKEVETLQKYMQRFSRVHMNTIDIHPAAVIVAF